MTITTRILLQVAAAAAVTISISTGVTYWRVLRAAEALGVSHLADYVRERARAEHQPLVLVEQNLELARALFLKRIALPEYPSLDATWLARNEHHPDGAWRTKRAGYDGRKQASLWMGRAAPLTPLLKAHVLHAEDLLNDLILGWIDSFPSLYFIFPEQVNIGYDPRIANFVWDAAADYDTCAAAFYQEATPARNPTRRIVWGATLREPVSQHPYVNVTAPVYQGDRFIGIVGHDISLDELLRNTSRSGITGAAHYIFRRDGRIIAHPGMEDAIITSDGHFALQTSGDPVLAAMFTAATAHGEEFFSGYLPEGDIYYAASRLTTPDWVFLTTMPRASVREPALRSARMVLWYGLGALSLEVLLVGLIVGRTVTRPIADLRAATRRMAAGEGAEALVTRRRDELGELATAFNDMSARVQAEKATLEARVAERTAELARFAAIAEATSDFYGFADFTERIVYINPSGRVLLGMGLDEPLDGMTIADVHPAEAYEEVRRAVIPTALQSGTCTAQSILRRRDGRELPVTLTAVIPRAGDGTPMFVAAIIRDIGDRVRVEAERAERMRLLAISAEVAAALNDIENLGPMLQRCAEILVTNLDAAFVRIWSLDEARQVLDLKASAGLYTHLNGAHGHVPVGMYKIGQIAQERLPHLTNTVWDDPRVSDHEWARREGIVAFAGYPLMVEGRVVGVIALFVRRTLGDDILNAMAQVANSIALGVERKATETRLRESEDRFSKAFHLSPNAIALTRAVDGMFVDVNDAFLRISGFTRAEVIGRDAHSLKLYGDLGQRAEYLELLRTHGSIRDREQVLRAKDGSQRIMLLAGEILDLEGEPHVLSVALDITDRKQAESDVLKALERERELGEMKTSFVSMVSHEFRTPLGVIQSASDVLDRYLDRLSPERRRLHLEMISRSTRNLAQLVDGVLLLGRVEDGRMQFVPARVDLVSICHQLADEVHSATAGHATIEIETVGDLDAASSDAELLRHIFGNLLSNAVKYSEAGARVVFSIQRDGHDLLAAVRDTGIGISEADQANLFKSFARGHNVGQRPGTGLGLHIVQRCVGLHGGSVELTSLLGLGTTVTVRLPVFPTPDA